MRSAIELKWRKREGGPNWSEVTFLDFIVDGISLYEMIDSDLVSCLGWFLREQNEKAIQRLLLADEADFPDNRRSIYVCPECGDLGCGAISAVIESAGDEIVWRAFGYQNNYEENVVFDEYQDIGPFRFDAVEYSRVIGQSTTL